MAKKKLIFFAACSMVASGFTLASNVSLADRIGRFIADAFQFEGPISGLVSALVRSQDQNGDKPVISFQVAQRNVNLEGAAANSVRMPGSVEAVRSANVPTSDGGTQSVASTRRTSPAGADKPSGSPLIAVQNNAVQEKLTEVERILKGVGNGDVTASLVGDRPGLGPITLKSIANTVGTIEIPPLAVAQADTPLVLAAVTNGEVAAGVATATATADEPGTVAQAITTQAVQPTAAVAVQNGEVPLPGTLVLLGLGALGLSLSRRKA